MSIPFFLPLPKYVPRLDGSATHSLRTLCEAAGVPCRASGEWTERPIEILAADRMAITAEPGGYGKVRLEFPADSPQGVARTALAILAYGLHDLVAKQSIAGQAWSRAAPPMGRPKAARAMTPKERQKIFRARKAGLAHQMPS